jgi:hypothetical protein
LCRWPGKEGLIRPSPKSGNATNINNLHLHAIWVRPSITQATTITIIHHERCAQALARAKYACHDLCAKGSARCNSTEEV